MRVVVFGDVMGRPGRRAVEKAFVQINREENPDFCIINGENIAGGFGINRKAYLEMTEGLGVDAITSGNHWADKDDAFTLKNERLVIPANMHNVADEGDGLKILSSRNGVKVAVLNLIGRVFMQGQQRDPFKTVSRLVAQIPDSVKIRILDIHAETGSEKQGLAYFLRDRMSFVYGTHSHVQTADDRIFPWGTGYITDIGATGGYDSILGMEIKPALHRLLNGQKAHLTPARENPWACYVIVDIDEQTGRCLQLRRFRVELDTGRVFFSVQAASENAINRAFLGS